MPLSQESSGTAAVKTLLLTDLVDSVRLVSRVGDARASEVTQRHDRLARDLLIEIGGREIDKTDGFLLLFDRPIDAVRFSVAFHQGLTELSAELAIELRARAGIHLGEVFLHVNDPEDVARGAKPLEVEGLAKVTAARLMSLAEGEQTLLTRSAFDLARRAAVGAAATSAGELCWLAHGPYLFQGIDEPIDVFEVGREDAAPLAAPPDSVKARRAVPAGDELTLGWRPAAGQQVAQRRNWILQEKHGEGGFGEVWLAVHEKTGEKRVFKFCHRADRLRALRREVTLFRVLREALGRRRDIGRILDWNFDCAPYFLESEYTDGGSLIDWAATHGEVELATRLELMAQVAEALDAAHSVGVLHKDVKPSNVLIETDRDGRPRAVLSDFGIGLFTEKGLLAARGITGSGLTELVSEDRSPGIGTLIYMAPELAEGKPATVRTDIYALGVMIYQVVAGDLSRALAPGWERDVDDWLLREDIAEFLDHSPERRPRSALEVARRLRLLEERRAAREAERRAVEEARRARRRRKIFITTAAVAASFLIVVSLLAFQAIAAREEAELRRRQAEGLLTYMIEDLRTKLYPVGRLELMDDVGEKALDYFASLPADRLTDDDRARRSQALSLLGEVRVSRGDLPEAVDAFRQALAILDALASKDPARSAWQRGLGINNFLVGKALLGQGHLDQASRHFQRFLEISERLVKEDADNPRWQTERAYSLSTIGQLLKRRGELEQAAERFRSALEINRQLAASEPSNTRYQRNLAVNYNAIASVLEAEGDLEGALGLYRLDLEIKRELVAREPENSLLQIDLATSHNLVGQVLAALGQGGASLENYGAAVGILERWVVEDPTNMTWKRNLAINHLRVGQGLLAAGSLRQAEERFGSANEILEDLTGKDPSKISWQRDLARTHLGLGETLLVQARHRDALARARAAMAILEPAAREHPENRSLRLWLVAGHLLSGRVRAALGREAEARVAWSRALELIEPVARGSEDGRLLDRWAQALFHLGRIDEARPIASRLLEKGYRDPGFLEVCRLSGIE